MLCTDVKQKLCDEEMKLVETCSGEEKLLNYLLSDKKVFSERLHNLKLVLNSECLELCGERFEFMYIIIETNLGHLDELRVATILNYKRTSRTEILITQVISQPRIYPTIKHRDSIQ